jgi:diguanylate cyclase (GGDEF)-like protein
MDQVSHGSRTRRAAAIARLGVLERSADPALTALSRIASYVSGARGAAVHIIDEHAQHRVAGTDAAPVGDHPREDAMCHLVVDHGERIVCADATRDPRFGFSSFVAGDEPVRFYASFPLRTSDDVVIGTLCTFDTVQLTLSAEQEARLEDLADQVAAQIELTQIAVELGHAASHDPLTGAVNRLVLGDRLAQAFARQARHSSQTFVAVLDVDDFKAINDVHGHDTGDQVLVEVVRRVQDALRAEDTIARIGGDEFVVLAELTPSESSADVVVERLQTALAPPMQLNGTEHRVIISIGWVLATPGEPVRSLLARADAAMYDTKADAKAGRPVSSLAVR